MLAFSVALVLADAVILAWCPHTLIFCSPFSPILLPASDLFQCLDIVGCEGIPNRAGILYYRSYECFVCCIFQPLIGDLNVAPEEAQGLVGFVADIGDMGDIGDSAEE